MDKKRKIQKVRMAAFEGMIITRLIMGEKGFPSLVNMLNHVFNEQERDEVFIQVRNYMLWHRKPLHIGKTLKTNRFVFGMVRNILDGVEPFNLRNTKEIERFAKKEIKHFIEAIKSNKSK